MNFLDSSSVSFVDLWWADWFVLGYYILIAAVLVSALWFAIQAFRRRITWGQARVMGVPFALYGWIQAMFLFVLIDGAFGIAAFILSTPMWLDLAIAGIGIAVPLVLFFILKRRPTFKPHLFIALVLIPLGIPGTHLVARLARVGAVEVGGAAGLAVLKYADDVAPFAARHVDEITELVPVVRNLPHFTSTIAGQARFVSTIAKGRFGDALTARRMTALGFTKLKSKYNLVNGIDGVYIKRDAGGSLVSVVIVENKVDKGWLAPGQMSDQWIADSLARMATSADSAVQDTARAVLPLFERKSPALSKELWHHDLATGVTTIRAVDASGKAGPVLRPWDDASIKNRLVKVCSQGSTTCTLMAEH
jgi:hypothetical protein